VEATTIVIDLAKNVFAVCGANAVGMVVWPKELRRAELLRFMRRMAPCLIRMEACGGAHYWARQIQWRAVSQEMFLSPCSLRFPDNRLAGIASTEQRCVDRGLFKSAGVGSLGNQNAP
jgi:hypothetical protein